MSGIISQTETVVRISDGNPDRTLSEVVDGLDERVVAVGPTGLPAIEPLVTVTRETSTAFFMRCTEERLRTIASDPADALDDGAADAVVEHESDRSRLPIPAIDGLEVGTRRLLGGCGWRRPLSTADHEAAGGFVDVDRETIVDAGETVLGRGWGDWCHDRQLTDAWESARSATGEAAVVVNGHGSTADTLLLSSVPFEVLEGAQLTAQATDASRIVVYLSRENDDVRERIRAAIERYPSPTVPMDVVTGPAAYRAAEPTMAIEAIEGNHRLEARLRPPGPDVEGLHGDPTLVHTARTLAHLATAVRDGTESDTRIVTVTGDVDHPATVELAETDTLERALDAVTVDRTLKAACVGGKFGGLTTSLDVTADADALTEAGLGTDGTVQILSDDRCVVEFVGKRAQFAADENCGRCVPCREGTAQLTDLLRDVYDGQYAEDAIEELLGVIERSSICAFGVEATRPAGTAMAEFSAEFEAHAAGRCPADRCTMNGKSV